MHLIRLYFKDKLAEDFMRGLFMMLMRYLFLIVSILVEAIQMSTHNICFYKEVDTTTQAVI